MGNVSLTASQKELLKAAQAARKMAHAPYSNYFVGAAIRTKSGAIISGANVENASYGLTICAERAAVAAAVVAGERDWEAIAVVTRNGGSPCGACRQVLSEFKLNLPVIVADENLKDVEILNLADLLPRSFSQEQL